MRRCHAPWALLCLVALWGWAIWSCAEHWEGNPNYSYGWVVPVLALFFGIRRYLALAEEPLTGTTKPFPTGLFVGVLAGLGALVFGLEYAREEMWHQEFVLWSICAVAAAVTLLFFWRRGHWALVKAELFPVLFFFTAVPWPPRIEQPITATLIRWVATITAELLHWLGIEAQAAGGAIALRSGLVGITEACSGIRSLQAGVMFGLAMGEWFLLRPGRRLFLLVLAIGLAFLTNLARTLTLSLQAQRHGAASIDEIHDLVGNIVITALVLGIWLAGKLMAGRADESAANWMSRMGRLPGALLKPASAMAGAFCLTILAAVFAAHFAYARVTAGDQTQTRPRFVARIDEAKTNRLAAVPREVWNELRPTSGEYVRHDDTALPGGGADCFHFFWKPSAWNRFALVHRPDICMPGIGWKAEGAPEAIEVTLDGKALRFYAFRFQRGKTRALELWGAWRNGDPVPLDYTAEQVFGTAPAPAALELEGKRRSATEIVACSLIQDGATPDHEMAVALLRAVFNYKADE